MDNDLKKIDIIILTHKPKHYLIETLIKINMQVLLPDKIIIYNTDEKSFFDNIKKDEFDSAVKNLKFKFEFYNIDYNEFDHGKTRNEAASKSNSPFIMFMTDDAVPYDEFLTINLLKSFEDKKVALAYAKQLPRENSKYKEKIIREFNYSDCDIVKDIYTEKKYGIKNYFCSNVCSMYNKTIFDLFGGFDENIILNEDTFYSYKIIKNGYKVMYKSDARVIHSHDYTYTEQYKRNFDIGVSHIDKENIFNDLPAEDEGKKLVLYVLSKLIKKFRIFESIDLIIECIFRYKGFMDGKNYKRFDLETCLNKTNNMQYFINKNKI